MVKHNTMFDSFFAVSCLRLSPRRNSGPGRDLPGTPAGRHALVRFSGEILRLTSYKRQTPAGRHVFVKISGEILRLTSYKRPARETSGNLHGSELAIESACKMQDVRFYGRFLHTGPGRDLPGTPAGRHVFVRISGEISHLTSYKRQARETS